MRFLLSTTFLFFSSAVVAIEEVTKQKTTQVPSLASSVVSVFIALVFIIIIIIACAWVLRRMGGAGFQKSADIKVCASHMLGAKERLVIIKVDGKHILLGVTPSSINKIEELSENCIEETSSDPISFQSAFSSQVKKMLGKRDEN
ncbi:flagellar biosynthetic protein FliO [Pleionea sediminis]|uniref:flagellar biosynthetic protein FliO n=1 Tax=Pleionea sediminis TaxID=2569479 RepID=UPI001186FC32|nr:flagellar biosynthetic protein FliO [Pleionea sediminis]